MKETKSKIPEELLHIKEMYSDSVKRHVFTRRVDQFFKDIYDISKFFRTFFKEAFRRPFHFNELINQCYEVGLRSLPLITLTGFIIGIVFTMQSRPSLVNFGAASWLPSLMGIAIVKSLGPLVTSLICAGKVGSGIGAELGSMKVTEQIEAMEVSSVHPFKYLVVNRILATTIAIPILSFYTCFVALMGSYINVHFEESSSLITFYQNAFSTLTFIDVIESIIKRFLMGLQSALLDAIMDTTPHKEPVEWVRQQTKR